MHANLFCACRQTFFQYPVRGTAESTDSPGWCPFKYSGRRHRPARTGNMHTRTRISVRVFFSGNTGQTPGNIHRGQRTSCLSAVNYIRPRNTRMYITFFLPVCVCAQFLLEDSWVLNKCSSFVCVRALVVQVGRTISPHPPRAHVKCKIRTHTHTRAAHMCS